MRNRGFSGARVPSSPEGQPPEPLHCECAGRHVEWGRWQKEPPIASYWRMGLRGARLQSQPVLAGVQPQLRRVGAWLAAIRTRQPCGVAELGVRKCH